jgi:hypothetical protein
MAQANLQTSKVFSGRSLNPRAKYNHIAGLGGFVSQVCYGPQLARSSLIVGVWVKGCKSVPSGFMV